MLRIANRPAMAWWSSVLSLASRTRGSSSRAACAKAGAIWRQGPHQGAQKSTSTGMWLRATWRSNESPSSSSGTPANKGLWHLPQSGAWARSASCTRLVVWQWGQTICRASVMATGHLGGTWGVIGCNRCDRCNEGSNHTKAWHSATLRTLRLFSEDQMAAGAARFKRLPCAENAGRPTTRSVESPFPRGQL
ncbi:hypothetical protein D3C71_1455680 [compost metagenome]